MPVLLHIDGIALSSYASIEYDVAGLIYIQLGLLLAQWIIC